MESWVKNEPDLEVMFWTDESIDRWVEERFEGTDVWEAWKIIETTKHNKIKKADMFRAIAIWYYGGVYADLDIELKESLKHFIEREETVIVWEPEWAMEQTSADAFGGYYRKERGARRTLMLSAFLVSGRRYSDFLGFYVNWIVANTLSGRSGYNTHVLDHTGPIAEAEAYWYYVGRLEQHDTLLRLLPFEEFQRWGEHYTVSGESTWESGNDAGACVPVETVYKGKVVVFD